MLIYSDKRSQKFDELVLNNNVEICWLFFKSKCQFRFRGAARIDLGKDKLSHWDNLSEENQTMWSWPNPGDHFFNDRKNEISTKTNHDLFNNFCLLKIDISYVDQLVLKKPIHTRMRWIRKKEWIQEQINP